MEAMAAAALGEPEWERPFSHAILLASSVPLVASATKEMEEKGEGEISSFKPHNLS